MTRFPPRTREGISRYSQCDKVRLSLSSPFISMIIEPLEKNENDTFTYLALPIKMLK